MQIIEATRKSAQYYAKHYTSHGLGFQDKALRDEVARILKVRGVTTAKKHTSSAVQTHPQYVADYDGTLEIGFGNSQYQTYFSKLYYLEG